MWFPDFAILQCVAKMPDRPLPARDELAEPDKLISEQWYRCAELP